MSYPYTLICSKNGCSETFTVHTKNYESNCLPQKERLHMETVHNEVAAPEAFSRPEKAEDIDKSCISKVEKGLHEMTREEWMQWLDMWS